MKIAYKLKVYLKNRLGISGIHEKLDLIHEMLAKILIRGNDELSLLNEAEFKIYSQSGEDGLIQWLISKLKISSNTFIEFGVETYKESNTRFLLFNNYWKGLIIDGDADKIEEIKNEFKLNWSRNITSVCIFINKENIDQIISENNFQGEIGLLSIDIDGNDYWVWECINSVDPTIVVIEYNALFGNHEMISTPYDPNFMRTKAHYSNIYYGASLAALENLGKRKGYSLIGTNLAGNNAFFVKNSKLNNDVIAKSSKQCFHDKQYREAYNEEGFLTYENRSQSLEKIKTMPVYDFSSGSIKLIEEVFELR
jgi:hypothetical protein